MFDYLPAHRVSQALLTATLPGACGGFTQVCAAARKEHGMQLPTQLLNVVVGLLQVCKLREAVQLLLQSWTPSNAHAHACGQLSKP